MKISVINKKGGVGKTPLAFSIAKDLGLFLQSNDNSCIEKIYPNMAKIRETVADIDNCVFDFGGFVSHGVIEIIKNSNWIIIPCLPDYNSLLRTAETIKEIKEINKNIIILATDYKDQNELEFLITNLTENFKEYKVIYFRNSKIFKNAINFGKSFNELINENAISQNGYKNFAKEYHRLLEILKTTRGE